MEIIKRISYEIITDKGEHIICDEVGPQTERFIRVKKDDRYALFTYEGKQLTDFCYKSVDPFHWRDPCYVRILKDDGWGLINTEFKEVIEPKYGHIEAYGQYYIVQTKEGKEILFERGKRITDEYDHIRLLDYSPMLVRNNGKYGLVQRDGKVVCEPIYDLIYPPKKKTTKVVLDGKYGFIDTNTGKVIGEIKYDFAGVFIVAEAMDGHLGEIPAEFIYIDKYKGSNDFINGYAEVKISDKYGFIDENGREICDIIFDEVTSFNVAGFAEVRIGEKWFKLNKEGEITD